MRPRLCILKYAILQGLSATAGLKGRIGHVCKEDAEVVKSMRAAGAIIIGLTNTRLVIKTKQGFAINIA